MNFYYTDEAGAVAGPVTGEQLQKLIDSGQIAADGQVCVKGSEDWKPLSAFVRPTPNPKITAPTAKPVTSAATAATPKTEATPTQSASAGSSAFRVYALTAVGFVFLTFFAWKLTAIESFLEKRFEYMIASPRDYLFDSEMTDLGKQGWEIVSARRATSSNEYDKTVSYEVILKRQMR